MTAVLATGTTLDRQHHLVRHLGRWVIDPFNFDVGVLGLEVGEQRLLKHILVGLLHPDHQLARRLARPRRVALAEDRLHRPVGIGSEHLRRLPADEGQQRILFRQPEGYRRRLLDRLQLSHVAFADAQAYARWLAERSGQRYRLPSEAEWEYVLRAGETSAYPWGERHDAPEKGNLAGDRDRFPNGRNWRNAIRAYGDGYWALAPVRSYSSEGFGTFDMVGNVSEWVEDCWHADYRRAPADGAAWVNPGCRERVQRGSAWLSAVDQSRLSFRTPAEAERTNARLGFRVVRDL